MEALLGVIVGGAISSVTILLVSRRERKFRLAMVALDKRLNAYQEAFYHWHAVSSNLVNSTNGLQQLVLEAQDWLCHNRLYLDTDTSKIFFTCIHLASNYPERLEEYRGAIGRGEDVTKLQKRIQTMESEIDVTGDAIRKAVYRLRPVVKLSI